MMTNRLRNIKQESHLILKEIAVQYKQGYITQVQAEKRMKKVIAEYRRNKALETLQQSDPKAWQLACTLLSVLPVRREK